MPHVNKLFPVFAAKDLDRSIRYYAEVLGFEVAWRWGDPTTRAGLKIGDVEIQLDSGGAGVPPGSSVVYCHMNHVDDYFADCKARGATFSLELGTRPWGMKDFRVIDPDGNRIGFGEET